MEQMLFVFEKNRSLFRSRKDIEEASLRTGLTMSQVDVSVKLVQTYRVQLFKIYVLIYAFLGVVPTLA